MSRRLRGFGLMGLGVFMGLGVASVAAEHPMGAVVSALLFFTVLPVAVGLHLVRPPSSDGALRLQADRAWESELMRLAERRGGGLTVAEAVAHADLEPARAEEILDGLARRGLAEHRITDDGQIVYRFPDAPDPGRKRRASGVLDD